jgi:hypothetical protein
MGFIKMRTKGKKYRIKERGHKINKAREERRKKRNKTEDSLFLNMNKGCTVEV